MEWQTMEWVNPVTFAVEEIDDRLEGVKLDWPADDDALTGKGAVLDSQRTAAGSVDVLDWYLDTMDYVTASNGMPGVDSDVKVPYNLKKTDGEAYIHFKDL